ncbi:hypothetical protein KIPB_014614, partial [Kipferlia bialata]
VLRHSLCFIVSIAASNVWPDRRLVISHSLGHAYFFYFSDCQGITAEEGETLSKEVARLVALDLPIRRQPVNYIHAL